MKKLIVIALTLTLVSTLVMGCSSNKKPSPSPQSSSAPVEQPSQSIPASKPEESPVPVSNDVQNPKLVEATGVYNGKVDTNFIEIKLDNSSTPTEFSIAEITDNLKGYNKNDKVKITFTVSEDKQYILKSIEKVK